ncbi:family 10 glycoside hydrolase, partial [Phakopsora pachyrhizi]
YVGTAVTSNSLGVEKPYDDAIKKYFTVLTPENEMKWESLKPDINGQYKFENLDKIFELNKSDNKKIRGHTFIWHRQYPKWLESLDKNSLLEETKKHVEVIMERYASRMTSMDVCNEIIGDDGSLRQNIWMQKIGEDYIAQVFKIAREASQKYNPQLKLYVNDYSIEGVNKKSNKLYDVAKKLKGLGLLDGVGFQSHFEVGGVPKDMKENMQRFADLGLDVAISELDVRMELKDKNDSSVKKQGEDFSEVFTTCKQLDKCVGVTVWGVSDKDSWVPQEFPGWGEALLFDESYKPKPTLDSVIDIMRA